MTAQSRELPFRRSSVVLTLALAAVLLTALVAAPAGASNEIGKQTGMTCTACHDKPGSELLTDQGKYFEVMGTMDGFDAVMQVFGTCTHCHVQKPGSQKLTPAGRRFSNVMRDMSAFQDWVRAAHPMLGAEGEEGEDEGAADGSEPMDKPKGEKDHAEKSDGGTSNNP